MRGATTSVVLTCLLGLAAGMALAQPAQPAQPGWPSAQPPHMTSDSVEFCRQLGGQVQQEQQTHPDAPAHVRALSDEGRTLCEQGKPRRGIARLRWAMMLLRNPP
jgi:hypothetical protein